MIARTRSGYPWLTLRRAGSRAARDPLPKEVLTAYSTARTRARWVPTVALRLLVRKRAGTENYDEIAHARLVAARRELAWRHGRLP